MPPRRDLSFGRKIVQTLQLLLVVQQKEAPRLMAGVREVPEFFDEKFKEALKIKSKAGRCVRLT